MIRKAFRMSVHPGHEEEYARRHNPIWQELADTLVAHGVTSYSIFLDPATRDLFAYAEIESEVVLIGLYERIELWSPLRWEAYLSRLEERHEMTLGKILSIL